MDREEVKAIRTGLGLTQRELGNWLLLSGRNPAHTVRMWEMGRRTITGPAIVCLRAFRAGYRPKHVTTAGAGA